MTTIGPSTPVTPAQPEQPADQADPAAEPSADERARFKDALDKPTKSDAKPNDEKTPADRSRPSDDRPADDSLSSLFRRRDPVQGRGDGTAGGDGGLADAETGKTADAAKTPGSKGQDQTDIPNRATGTPGKAETGRKADPAADPAAAQAMTPADAMLKSMMQQSQRAEAPQETQAATRPEPTLSDVVREVADRILVSEAGSAGGQEVRIILKDSVLGGTEVHISEHEGAVNIKFVAGNAAAENFLGSKQQDITSALGERLHREVRVEVTDRDGGKNNANTQDGHQPGGRGQEQNDGRSRNRRSVQDEQDYR